MKSYPTQQEENKMSEYPADWTELDHWVVMVRDASESDEHCAGHWPTLPSMSGPAGVNASLILLSAGNRALSASPAAWLASLTPIRPP